MPRVKQGNPTARAAAAPATAAAAAAAAAASESADESLEERYTILGAAAVPPPPPPRVSIGGAVRILQRASSSDSDSGEDGSGGGTGAGATAAAAPTQARRHSILSSRQRTVAAASDDDDEPMAASGTAATAAATTSTAAAAAEVTAVEEEDDWSWVEGALCAPSRSQPSRVREPKRRRALKVSEGRGRGRGRGGSSGGGRARSRRRRGSAAADGSDDDDSDDSDASGGDSGSSMDNGGGRVRARRASTGTSSSRVPVLRGGRVTQPRFLLAAWTTALPVGATRLPAAPSAHRVGLHGAATAEALEAQVSASGAPLPACAVYFVPQSVAHRGAAPMLYLRLAADGGGGGRVAWWRVPAAPFWGVTDAWATAFGHLAGDGVLQVHVEAVPPAPTAAAAGADDDDAPTTSFAVFVWAGTATLTEPEPGFSLPSYPPRGVLHHLAVVLRGGRLVAPTAAAATDGSAIWSRIVEPAACGSGELPPTAAATDAAPEVPVTPDDLYAAAAPLPGEVGHAAAVTPAASGGSEPDAGVLARVQAALKPTLRRYQRRAVAWWLRRESRCVAAATAATTAAATAAAATAAAAARAPVVPAPGTAPTTLTSLHAIWAAAAPVIVEAGGGAPSRHPLFAVVHSADGEVAAFAARHRLAPPLHPRDPVTFYLHAPGGQVAASGAAVATAATVDAASQQGGILADEMGLGKTVMTLAVVAATEPAAAAAAASAVAPRAVLPATVAARLALVVNATGGPRAAPPRPPVPASMFDQVSPAANIACICGTSYLAPLTPEQTQAVTLLRRRGAVDPAAADADAARPRVHSDTAEWVSCRVCRRWQHALCGGYGATDLRSATPFVCTECQAALQAAAPLCTATSLVICPPPLRAQWLAEIQRHTVAGAAPTRTFSHLLPQGATRGRAAAAAAAAAATEAGPRRLRIVEYTGVKATLAALRATMDALARLPSATPAPAPASTRRAPATAAGTKRRGGSSDDDDDGDEAMWDDSAVPGAAPAAAAAAAPPKRTRREDDDAESPAETPHLHHDDVMNGADSNGTDDGAHDDDGGRGGSGEESVAARRASLRREAVRLAQTLSPWALARADVVLTTYAVLADDLDHVDKNTADVVTAAAALAARGDAAAGDAHFVRALLAAAAAAADGLAGVTESELARGLFKGKATGEAEAPLARRVLRHAKKFRIVVSPLVHLLFYRVCVDEAQALDAPVVRSAAMARRLPAVHRWCISGTPFQRSVADLWGLLTFLGWAPWAGAGDLFTHLLARPAAAGDVAARTALLRLAHAALWRTRAADVVHELDLPPMSREVITLPPSRIETAFYRRLYATAEAALRPLLSAWRADGRRQQRRGDGDDDAGTAVGHRWAGDDAPLTAAERDTLVGPLLRLRQACVHPQIAHAALRARARRPNRGQEAVSTMADVLDMMVNQARLDCEEELRTIMWALHARGGVHWALGEMEPARAAYLAAVDLINSVETAARTSALPRGLSIDSLQRIHALRSLQALTDGSAAGGEAADAVPATARAHAATLGHRAQVLEDAFLASAATRVAVKWAAVRTHAANFVRLVQQRPASDSSGGGGAGGGVATPNAGIAVPPGEVASTVAAVTALNPAAQQATAAAAKLLFDTALITRRGRATLEREVLDSVVGENVVTPADLEANPVLRGTLSTSVVWDVDPTSDAAPTTVLSLLLHNLVRVFDARNRAWAEVVPLLTPSPAAVAAAVDCGTCRADWGKRGPPCFACRALLLIRVAGEQWMNFRARHLAELATDGDGGGGGGAAGGAGGGGGGGGGSGAGNLAGAAALGTQKYASGRAQRRTKKGVFGTDGKLNEFLAAEVATTEGDGTGDLAGELIAEAFSAQRDAFAVPTAVNRLLRALVGVGEAATEGDAVAAYDWSDYLPGGGGGGGGGAAAAAAASDDPTFGHWRFSTPEARPTPLSPGGWLDEVLAALTAEAAALTALAREQQQLLFAMDELRSSLLHIVLVPEEEVIPEAESGIKMHRSDVPARLASFRDAQASSEAALARARGQYSYLLNIRAEETAAGSSVGSGGGVTTTPSAAIPTSTAAGAGAGAAAAAASDSSSDAAACPICLEDMRTARVAVLKSCAHRFCASHLTALASTSRQLEVWGRGELRCPVCRGPFSEDSDVIMVAAPKPQKAHQVAPPSPPPPAAPSGARAAPLQSGPGCCGWLFDAEAVAARQPAGTRVVPPPMVGSYGTKIEALVRSITWLRSDAEARGAPPLQVLVFSEWNEALSVAAAALHRNDVSCLQVDSGSSIARVVSKFVTDASITVLLMPLRTGAEGLNLHNATHVFFLEPVLSRAVEAQAIGRVYRMGQTQPTTIHHLVAAGTVEDAVLHLGAASAPPHGASAAAAAAAYDGGGSSGGGSVGGGVDVDAVLAALAAQQVAHHHDGGGSGGGGSSGGALKRSNSSGKHAGDALGAVTRGDILRLFDAEAAFVASLTAAAAAPPARTRTRHGGDGEATDGGSGDDSSGGGEEGEAASGRRRAAPRGRAALKAAATQVGVVAARNNAFWTMERVTLAHEPAAAPTIRLALLSRLTAGGASSSATVALFGREVPVSAARALLTANAAPGGGGGGGIPPAIRAALDTEAGAVLAALPPV